MSICINFNTFFTFIVLEKRRLFTGSHFSIYFFTFTINSNIKIKLSKNGLDL